MRCVSRGLHCGQPAPRIISHGWQIPATHPRPPFQEMVFLTRDESVEGDIEDWAKRGWGGGGRMLKQLAAHSLLGCFKKIMLF